jgi:hypothetical protein
MLSQCLSGKGKTFCKPKSLYISYAFYLTLRMTLEPQNNYSVDLNIPKPIKTDILQLLVCSLKHRIFYFSTIIYWHPILGWFFQGLTLRMTLKHQINCFIGLIISKSIEIDILQLLVFSMKQKL